MEVIHTALWTDDIDATLEFYTDVLDLERVWSFTADDGVENVYIGTEDGAELQFKYDPGGDAVPEPTGIDHVALEVDDTDATYEHVVEETDCDVEIEPVTMDHIDVRAAFVYDPSGYVVEFVEHLD
ncbi:VOC family protein [Natronorubrum texcoconense]|uniref:Lactoylglutathione lyase n=1 Tax=Natronorubrum texcoconense TaxID=1095776 RepID=A0A1G8VKP1_9EURY|nr:VOC family protein [Natronorubrum texcoconense]SDJ66529.1 lactoylglutathione lyase [Natronorubrum texcoconense]